MICDALRGKPLPKETFYSIGDVVEVMDGRGTGSIGTISQVYECADGQILNINFPDGSTCSNVASTKVQFA